MKWQIKVIVAVAFLTIGVALLYQFTGLKYLVRATGYINTLPSQEKKNRAWNDFNGTISKEYYSGILAGSWRDKIFVWGRDGLHTFTVDQYSVYSFIDTCSDAYKKSIQNKSKKVREIDFVMSKWRKKVHQGDFVSIVVAGVKHGGTLGNLREIYTYNRWPFVQGDLEVQCAK